MTRKLDRTFLHAVSADEGEAFDVAGAHLVWKAKGADLDYAFSVCAQQLGAGEKVPLHSHPYPEVFFVTAGPVQFYRGRLDQEDWISCDTGTTVIAPADALHGFRNSGFGVCHVLGVSTYLHQTFFDAVADAQRRDVLDGHDETHVMAKIAAIGRDHKMYFLTAEEAEED